VESNTPEKAQARALLGMSKDEVCLLYLGRVTDEYKADLEPLLLAVRQVLNRYPRITLMIAGHNASEGYGRRVMKLASELGLESILRIVPNFPRFAKSLLYASADIFVSPVDNVQETFGLTLLEAMSHSLPVVASDWSGYRDLVVDGETGFLIPTITSENPFPDWFGLESAFFYHFLEYQIAQRTAVDVGRLILALETLSGSSELRATMGSAGRRRVKRLFDRRVVSRQFVALWQDQIRDAHEGSTPLCTKWDLGYHEALKIYASRHLKCTDYVTSNARGVSRTDYFGAMMMGVPPFPLTGSEIAAILDLCGREPIRISSLIDSGLVPDLSCILRLLKKGLLVLRSD
jgi:D-inositol-3-phosphate glycosyltransferase